MAYGVQVKSTALANEFIVKLVALPSRPARLILEAKTQQPRIVMDIQKESCYLTGIYVDAVSPLASDPSLFCFHR